MRQKLISNYNVIVFLFFSNMPYFSFIGFDYLMKTQKQMIWVGILFLFLITTLFFLLWRKLPKDFNLLKDVKNNHIFRIITVVYIFINSAVIVTFSCLVIKKYFYEVESIYVFFVILIIAGLLIGYQNIKTIIYLSSLLFSCLIIFYLIPFFNGEERSFLYLLPFDLNSNIFKILLLIYIPLDNFLLVFYKSQFKDSFSKKTVLITNTLFFIYLSVIVIDALTLFGANFFDNILYGGFYRWKLFTSKSFILSDSIVVLSIIIVSSVFRLGFYINLMRLLLFQKKKNAYFLGIGLLLLGAVCLLYTNYNFLKSNYVYFTSLLSILMVSIYLFILFKCRRLYGKTILDSN